MPLQGITGTAAGLLAILFLLVSHGVGADDPTADDREGVLEEFPIAEDAPVPFVPVTLDGKTYSFCVDTGSSFSAFDTSLRVHLGPRILPEQPALLESEFAVPVYEMPPLQIGRLKPPPDARVVCMNFLGAHQRNDQPIDGLIGMDFLRQHILQFDCDDQKLRFLNSIPAEPGERFPLRFGKTTSLNIPQIRLVLGTATSVLNIDTGSGGSLRANSKLFNELDNAGHFVIRASTSYSTLAGRYEQRYARLDQLNLGSFTHRDLTVDCREGANHIGFSYLKRFIVTFDFPKRAMYLKPGKGINSIDKWDLSGLHISRVKGEIVIDAVDSGSPAESAGLQKKDAFVQVNDLPIDEFSLTRLRTMLRDPTRSVALTIRRGEETKRMELLPQEFRTKAGSPLVSPQAASEP
jgi:hypothetical protein